jgi:hypothetical protein
MLPIPITPSAGSAGALAAALAGRVGLPADDVSAGVVADLFTVFGGMVGESGIELAAMGLFRSPDDPDRPASVVLTGTRMASDHESPEVAIRGLRDLHTGQGADTVETVTLPAGPAVVVVEESTQELPADGGAEPGADPGAEPAVILTRRATAWIPDPDGTTVAVVSVISPSWQDWAHTCDLALDIFDSVSWE